MSKKAIARHGIDLDDAGATSILDFIDNKEKVAYNVEDIAKKTIQDETTVYIVLLEGIIKGYVERKYIGDGLPYYRATDAYREWKKFNPSKYLS